MKKLVWISEGCWFPDSLLYFKEQGFKITIIRTPMKFGWNKHYKLFAEFAEVIDWIPDLQLPLDKDTLVIGGGNFMNISHEYVAQGLKEFGHNQLDVLYAISKYNHDFTCGATIVRYFNGDTGFGSQENIDIFAQKTKYIDVFMFDNDQLRDFVFANVPSAKTKKTLLGWIETPLERFVYHNQNPIEKRVCSLGRILCSAPKFVMDFNQLPIRFFPVKKLSIIDKFKGRQKGYQLAGTTDSTKSLFNARKLFYKFESKCAFGLSHMYDTFSGSVEDFRNNKEFYFSVWGQNFPHNVCSCHETYYPFCNNVNKDVCYLMNGIIPLVSHNEHNIYREMVARKMAILIKTPADIWAALNIPDTEIQEYRDNIYKYRELFTFDHVGKVLIDLVK